MTGSIVDDDGSASTSNGFTERKIDSFNASLCFKIYRLIIKYTEGLNCAVQSYLVKINQALFNLGTDMGALGHQPNENGTKSAPYLK